MAAAVLYDPTDDFRPFPTPEAVFGTGDHELAEYVLPLATVSLAVLDPQWQGDLHFVAPIEPLERLLGQQTKRYHSYYCRTNWIGYQIDERGCYELAGPLRFFEFADLDSRDDLSLSPEQRTALAAHYGHIRDGYAKRREHFAEAQALHAHNARRRNGRYSPASKMALVRDLAGDPGWGNWSEGHPFPATEQNYITPQGQAGTNFIPLTAAGSPFRFVGWIPTYAYVPGIAGSTLLFYSHADRIALTTFDWT